MLCSVQTPGQSGSSKEDRTQYRQGDQEAEQQLLARPVYSTASPSISVFDHKKRLISVVSQNR